MSDSPPRPPRVAVAAAFERAHHAITCAVAAAGPGAHRLDYAAEELSGVLTTRSLTVVCRVDEDVHVEADTAQLLLLRAALTFGLEGSTVRRAVLLLASSPDDEPVVCGWSVSDGWLHPKAPAEIRLVKVPGRPGALPTAYAAPAFSEPAVLRPAEAAKVADAATADVARTGNG